MTKSQKTQGPSGEGPAPCQRTNKGGRAVPAGVSLALLLAGCTFGCGAATVPTPESIQQTAKRYADPARNSVRPLAATAAVQGLQLAAEEAGVAPHCDVTHGPQESAIVHCEVPAGDAAQALLEAAELDP